MKITTLITIPDSVYAFYQKAAQEMGGITPQELMARVLSMCTGMTAEDMQKLDNNDFKIQ